MARYIDAVELQRRICGAKCGCEYEECGCEGDCAFDRFIFNAPTADVAPRAEVAREIFEEIEKLRLHITNEFDLRRYEELKKKYTE